MRDSRPIGKSFLVAAAIMAASAAAPALSIHPDTPGRARAHQNSRPSKSSHKQNARKVQKRKK